MTRVGKVEVKTITKSKYHMGIKVIVGGGTRIRYPGIMGSIEKANVWLLFFFLDFFRSAFMAFATGNLYIYIRLARLRQMRHNLES